jgi:hypothetical protein
MTEKESTLPKYPLLFLSILRIGLSTKLELDPHR